MRYDGPRSVITAGFELLIEVGVHGSVGAVHSVISPVADAKYECQVLISSPKKFDCSK